MRKFIDQAVDFISDDEKDAAVKKTQITIAANLLMVLAGFGAGFILKYWIFN